jgi:hypothetical protein
VRGNGFDLRTGVLAVEVVEQALRERPAVLRHERPDAVHLDDRERLVVAVVDALAPVGAELGARLEALAGERLVRDRAERLGMRR